MLVNQRGQPFESAVEFSELLLQCSLALLLQGGDVMERLLEVANFALNFSSLGSGGCCIRGSGGGGSSGSGDQ